VEDHLAVRLGLKYFLEHYFLEDSKVKVEVIEAEDGKIAIKKIHERPDVDVIITDHIMPNMTGIELVVWVKAHTQNIPIILHSTEEITDDRHKADIFLIKGDVNTLTQALLKVHNKI